MGHGTVADEIKGRAPSGPDRMGRVLSIDEDGVRFRSYIDGSERFMGPETSMEVQAKLGSDIALVFDECTPFHIDRDYTARSTERTHRWLDRCLAWHDAHGPRGQLVYGIVQGGVHEDLRIASTQEVAARPVDGIAIGGSLGADKAQMYEVVGWATAALGDDARPRHLLGIGDVDDLIRGVELGIDTFDCAMPTRLGRHGVAIVPEPAQPLARRPDRRAPSSPTRRSWRAARARPAAAGHSRGYLRYLLKNRELTGVRLLTLHNLAYLARLMAGLRAAIAAGHARRARGGAARRRRARASRRRAGEARSCPSVRDRAATLASPCAATPRPSCVLSSMSRVHLIDDLARRCRRRRGRA